MPKIWDWTSLRRGACLGLRSNPSWILSSEWACSPTRESRFQDDPAASDSSSKVESCRSRFVASRSILESALRNILKLPCTTFSNENPQRLPTIPRISNARAWSSLLTAGSESRRYGRVVDDVRPVGVEARFGLVRSVKMERATASMRESRRRCEKIWLYLRRIEGVRMRDRGAGGL
jgi:hypothetical protein